MDEQKPKDNDELSSIAVVDAPPEEKRKESSKVNHDQPSIDADASEHHPNQKPSKNTDKPSKGELKHFLKEKLTQKEYVIGAIIFVLALGGILAFALSGQASAPSHVAKSSPKPMPTVITSPLTGLPVTATQAKMTVTGVMIENSDFARPQSGLRQAGVVFEGIAEAGITRFLALYQEAKPANIGPIRSVRPYFLQWALGFDAPLAHVGGSPEALADITTWHAKNLDQSFNGAYYHRIASREAPHNVYTSMAQLNALEKTQGWNTSTFTGFVHKAETPSKHPTVTAINFAISSPDFYVHYDYDAKTNSYLRSEAGAPHIDASTGKQLSPKVVVALVMPYSLESDGYHSDYNTIGSGHLEVFQDGVITQGEWKKTSARSQFQFRDANSKLIKLDAGQTWITVVGAKSDIGFNGPTTK